MTVSHVMRTPPPASRTPFAPLSFKAHRLSNAAQVDGDSDSASPTARKARVPVTPPATHATSPPAPRGSPIVRELAAGQRLAFDNVGMSDYEFDESDAEVERADGICAIKLPAPSPFVAPFRTPVPVRKRSMDDEDRTLFFPATAPRPQRSRPSSLAVAATRTATKRRLTETSSTRSATTFKKPALAISSPATRAPQTPAETNRLLVSQMDSMKKLSLGGLGSGADDAVFGESPCNPRRRPRRVSTVAARTQQTTPMMINTNAANSLSRATANIFSSPDDTPTAAHFPHKQPLPHPLPLPPQPPQERVIAPPATARKLTKALQRTESDATLLFGGPKIPSPPAFKVVPSSPMPLRSQAQPHMSKIHRTESAATLLFGGPKIPTPPYKISAQQPLPPVLSVIPPSSVQRPLHSLAIAPTSPEIRKKFRPLNGSGSDTEPEDEKRDRLRPLSAVVVAAQTPHAHEGNSMLTPSVDPSASSQWPMLASRERRDVEKLKKERKSLGAQSSPTKKHVPGTPIKRQPAAFARNWMSTTKIPPGTVAIAKGKAPRQSLPLFSNAGHEDDDEEASPSIRPLVAKRMRASVGGALESSAHTRRASVQFGDTRRSRALLSSSSSSASDDDDEPITRAVPQRRRFSSSSDDTESGSPTKSARTSLFSASIRSQEENSEERPRKFEREYLEVHELGAGEFGQVLRAQRRVDGAPCAIKRSKRFEGAKNRLRLREEAEVLKLLTRRGGHTNVLRYVDSWEQDQRLYIETELCEYGSFARFLADYGSVRDRLDEARVWKVLADVSEGLRFIHDAGVIHLDLKPANIFVGGNGRLRIGDFGMASEWPRTGGRPESGFEREGDREYMAPEVLQGVYGPAADVFSLGMVVLETASNIIVPDMGEPWRKLREEDLSSVDLSTVSDVLVNVIRLMMRRDPAARPNMRAVCGHPVVRRARETMDQRAVAGWSVAAAGSAALSASPLSSEPAQFLNELLVGSAGSTDNTMI